MRKGALLSPVVTYNGFLLMRARPLIGCLLVCGDPQLLVLTIETEQTQREWTSHSSMQMPGRMWPPLYRRSIRALNYQLYRVMAALVCVCVCVGVFVCLFAWTLDACTGGYSWGNNERKSLQRLRSERYSQSTEWFYILGMIDLSSVTPAILE